MPIFYQKEIDAHTKLAIWKIDEDESFFLPHVPLQRNITHPHKRLQHLAGRYLLKFLFPEFPVSLIQIADTRKPFLEGETFHFSISHCDDFAAVIVSKEKRVGVDIELALPKVEKLQRKFTSDEERLLLDRSLGFQPVQFSTLIWSCKEAVFKWYGDGEVDFKEHIQIKRIVLIENKVESIILFKKNEDLFLSLHSQFFDELCLSYVVT